ncbi:NfeD family protein [Algoriphagus aquimarinus]|uniref:NfeD-like C-terminal, partner-binding n=1 Tax=Algoriphagus aquimarinus TaxID=237018 RepID=A0A1I0X7P6_9BACT|nr:NfeD family protein [Algoriphagus aquimarinus]SFA96390.1 NfeD-like C-terminal, partner-binding [Algoriphagus aquimarinus]|tara:strand:- start:56453 stop:56911 length:459 start_codon:yes stop_codon:yes gene_type:complete
MTIIVLSSLLIIGLVLLLAEVLFVPGTTVVGVFGLAVSLAGVVYAFLSFDAEVAWWITSIAVILNLVAIVYGFKSGLWNRFSLKSSMQGGAFDGRTDALQIGMPGKTISDLKPIGKASFGDVVYEVKSENGFIAVETDVTIIKIENNKILVK